MQKQKRTLRRAALGLAACLALSAPVTASAGHWVNNGWTTGGGITSGYAYHNGYSWQPDKNDRYYEYCPPPYKPVPQPKPPVYQPPYCPPPALSHRPTGTAYVGNCSSWVNVRSGAGTGRRVIGRAYCGERIEVLRWNSANTWCEIYYNNGLNTGWISGQFVK